MKGKVYKKIGKEQLKNLVKRRLAAILAGLLLVGGITLQFPTRVMADATYLQGKWTSTKLTVNNKDVGANQVVSLTDRLGLEFNFGDIPVNELEASGNDDGLSIAYPITIPDSLIIDAGSFNSNKLEVALPDPDGRCAIVTRTGDATFTVEFDLDNINNKTYTTLQNFNFHFDSSLNSAKAKDGDDITLTFGASPGNTYTIKVTDPSISNPSIAKPNGVYIIDPADPHKDQIKWTVNVIGTAKMGYNQLRIEDTIGKDQSYVPGSISWKIGDGGVASSVADDSTNPKVTAASNSLSFLFDYTAGTNYQLVYYTKPSDSLFLSKTGSSASLNDIKENAKLTNTAGLYVGETTTKLGDNANAEATVDRAKFMIKSGRLTGGANGEMEWTITVNTNGYDFKPLTIYDKLPSTAPAVLNYVAGSLTVKADGNSVPIQSGDDRKSAGGTDNNYSPARAYSFSYDLIKDTDN